MCPEPSYFCALKPWPFVPLVRTTHRPEGLPPQQRQSRELQHNPQFRGFLYCHHQSRPQPFQRGLLSEVVTKVVARELLPHHHRQLRPCPLQISLPTIVATEVTASRKECGSWCFCVNCCCLNNVTHRDSYPLPHINDTPDYNWASCSGSSKCDVRVLQWTS